MILPIEKYTGKGCLNKMAIKPENPLLNPDPLSSDIPATIGHSSLSERTRSLSDFVPVGYLSFNQKGIILEINRAGASFWGTVPELLVQKSLIELIAPDYEVPFNGFLKELFETGSKRTCEVKLIYGNKTLRYAQIVGIVNEDFLGEGQKCFAAIIDISERKRVEEALQLTEFSVNHAIDLVYWIEPSGRMSYVNDASCRALGFTREEIVSVSVHQFCSDFPADNWQNHWNKLRQIGLFTSKSLYHPKNGKPFPVEHTINYLHYNEKEYLVVFARDVSQQDSVEEALRNSEERYKRLFESISDYVYTVQVENNNAISTTHGPGCIHVTGYTPEEYKDDPNLWYGMIFEKDRPAVLEQAARSCKGESTKPLEHRIIHKDGSIRWIRNTPVIRNDGHGSTFIYEGIIVDITERKLATEKLIEEERFLSDIFTSVQDGISVLDHDYKILRVNPTMESWYAHAAPLTGKKCYEAFHNRKEPCDICPTRHTLSSRKTGYETIPKTGPKSIVIGWVDVYSYPLLDQTTGEMKGVIEYVRDITESRRAELKLAESNQELTRANKNLERLQRERDEFLVMISHDLRTPLVTGLGYIDLLLNGKFGTVSEEALSGMKVALKNLNRLQTLIGDVLNYQSLSMQNYSERLAMAPIFLDKLFQECSSELIIRTSRKEETVAIEINKDTPAVSGNLEMIRRALTNLLNNAHRHAGPDAKVVISAFLTTSGKEVQISIEDNGPGIPIEIRDRVFESFVKSGKSKEGSGLGLAIVRFIINAHGSTPILETEMGKGTRIAFNLPVADKAAIIAEKVQGHKDAPSTLHNGASILVVDDDTDTLDFVRLMLERNGYHITTASSAEKGLDYFNSTHFDMALVDMSLSGMSGIELCRLIKKDARGQQLPVYMFTARASCLLPLRHSPLYFFGFVKGQHSDVEATVSRK